MNLNKAYRKMQKAWIKENKIKVGDEVQVLRTAKSFECGWDTTWDNSMDICVNKIYEIIKIHKSSGIFVDDYWFPFFVLEKVVNYNITEHKPEEKK